MDGDEVTPVESIRIDQAFVSRLLLGALSEHEQRMIAVQLLSRDAAFRRDILRSVRPFRTFDLDLVARYAETLYQHRRDRTINIEAARSLLLDEAFTRIPDPEALIRSFTFSDVLRLGDTTRSLFSWSMAEFLLLRADAPEQSHFRRRTQLYLALMVIDVVEILGTTGHSPKFPAVIADVRQRIRSEYGPRRD